jgi:hypothetical protein
MIRGVGGVSWCVLLGGGLCVCACVCVCVWVCELHERRLGGAPSVHALGSIVVLEHLEGEDTGINRGQIHACTSRTDGGVQRGHSLRFGLPFHTPPVPIQGVTTAMKKRFLISQKMSHEE